MAQLIDGKVISAKVRAQVAEGTRALQGEHGVTPGLAVVRVGEDPASKVYVTGKRKDGSDGAVYLYHVADNERTMREYGHHAVVLQTAINPVIALELLADGTWSGTGVLGPEAFPADPFLELLQRQLQDLHRLDHPRRKFLHLGLSLFEAE